MLYRAILNPQQRESRVKNAVAEFLFRQLIVPKVYVDAPWPKQLSRVDVLAVDRSGSGDVHIVEVKIGTGVLTATAGIVASLLQIPAHFRYLAIFENNNYLPDEGALYAPNGMGRVGVIEVKEDDGGNLAAELRVRPERFRFDATFKQVDRFTAAHTAYIEVRP